ncbi:MAG: M20 family metallopeptidase [Acidaminococcus sp.]|uniref:M20 family metallopeptidase n=1 Tax=Acidaminococcus sp. TaxID=1872103 RepID=UPI002A758365|nr:M20 family metallopeptidase [Acidaminococcus sp.]MDY2739833.1 M20 family metallopeptidase [Acidaminococcus sp.]
MNESIFLEELKELVALESFSRDAAGTGRVAAWIKKRLDAAAWRTELISVGKEVGPILRAEWGEGKTYDVLLLGHMDTVFPAETTVTRPFSTEGDYFKGPGASDMKCGDLFMVHLAEALSKEKKTGHVLLLFTPDEEISSIYSRPIIEGEARKAKAVLIMESARPNGDLVKERKGISKYRLIFEGIAAHAGVNPDQGASAVHECMCWGHQIISLADPQKGTTVNIGTITGGTAANVVADHCECVIDVRIKDAAEGHRIDEALRAWAKRPFDARIKVAVEGGMKRPPMNPSEKTEILCRKAEEAAKKVGISFGWTKSGGGSDGNLTAALGIPTIDGLGPIGGKAHSVDEYGKISSIMPRYAFVKALVDSLL